MYRFKKSVLVLLSATFVLQWAKHIDLKFRENYFVSSCRLLMYVIRDSARNYLYGTWWSTLIRKFCPVGLSSFSHVTSKKQNHTK
jgi:hypothetical protein